MRYSTSASAFLTLACSLLISCNDSDQLLFADHAQPLSWSWVAKSDSAALLSVNGTSASDVWIAGADDGQGPVVLHFDGSEWQRRNTGVKGDLWWVNATPQGPVFFAGASALLLRYQDGAFERLKTPGLGKDVLYGVWAAGANDLYAVGTSAGRNGFVWHYDGSEFQTVSLPDTLPVDENHDQPGLFKVWGNSKDSVWVAGASGTLLHGNARDGFTLVRKGDSEILFTVNARGDHVLAVGGTSSGLLLDGRGTTLSDRTPASTPLLQGAWIDEHDQAWAVGVGGTVLRGGTDGFQVQDTGLDFAANDSLHSVWVDPTGGVWAVGGDVLTPNLAHGVALHGGAPVPEIDLIAPAPVGPGLSGGADRSSTPRLDCAALGRANPRRDSPRFTAPRRARAKPVSCLDCDLGCVRGVRQRRFGLPDDRAPEQQTTSLPHAPKPSPMLRIACSATAMRRPWAAAFHRRASTPSWQSSATTRATRRARARRHARWAIASGKP